LKISPNLPTWPPRRRRRRTDILWLEHLETVGITPYVGSFPTSPPTPLTNAVHQFNAGRFWDCHETLEDLWRATPYPLRHFYQGIIKIAVGLHHSNRHNAKGARNKLSEGLRLLAPFNPTFLGLDTGALARDVQNWLNAFEQPPRIDWAKLDRRAKPIIRTTGRSD